MNSRAIALGASVIALMLGAAAPAEADGLGDIGAQLPNTDVSAKVEAKVNAPVTLPKQISPAGIHKDGGARTTVGTKAHAGTGASGARVDWSARAETPAAKIGGGVRAEQHAQTKVAGKSGLDARVTGEARGSARADLGRHGRIHAGTKAKGRTAKSVKARPEALVGRHVSPPKGHSKDVVPLRGIGREVGNPIGLSLAGWLIALTGAGTLGVSRLVRRLHRLS